MKQFILAPLLFGVACSSTLTESNFDQSMRIHGTYLCPPQEANTDANGKRILHETNAEADVGRIRCYQDQWKIEGNTLSLTRLLYQSQHCENPLAKIELEKEGEQRTRCWLTKTNAGWVAEDKGVCFFKDLKPNVRSGLKPLLKCSRNLPGPCLHTEAPITVEMPKAKSTEINEAIDITAAGGYRASCKRYLQ